MSGATGKSQWSPNTGTNAIASGASAVIDEVTSWVEAPFIGSVDLLSLFLLTGVVLVFILVWNVILYHIRIASTEIV